MLGGVRSSTLIVCTPLVLLPQPSATVHVRRIILLLPQRFETESEYETVTALHASCPVAVPVAEGAVLEPHSTVRSAGRAREGGVVS